MKRFLGLFLLVSHTIFSQELPADSLDTILNLHFQEAPHARFTYKMVLSREDYPPLTAEKFTKSQVDREIALATMVMNSKLVNKPTQRVFTLCHNLLIHSPEKGRDLLVLLNKPTGNTEVINALYAAFDLAGEFGEKLVQENLRSKYEIWREIWAMFLRSHATVFSLPFVEKEIQETTDFEVKLHLISTLGKIQDARSIEYVKQIIDSTKDDRIQSHAIFAYAELTGRSGIKYLKAVSPVGEASKQELESRIAWLRESKKYKE